MRALVTGATGFLGSRLVQRLLSEGFAVTAVGRKRALGRALEAQGARFIPLALEDRQAVVQACRGQQAVFHCGALSAPWGRYADFYASNVDGTRHIIEGCRQHGVERLIHVSTPSIYFEFKDKLNIPEHSPLPAKAANAYTQTKLAAEALVDQAFADGLPVVTIRPRAIYGPGDNAIFPRLVQANEQRFVPLFRDGRIKMDITYVDNCVDALLLCLTAPEQALGQKYNITNGEPVLFIEVLERMFLEFGMSPRYKRLPYKAAYALAALMEKVATALPGRPEPPLTRYTVGTLAFHQTLDITAARQNLGYRPKVSNEEGVVAFAAWWKRQFG